jgi:hypothetical protein
MRDEVREKELLAELFRLRGVEYAKCWWPVEVCTEPAIRAHSVQNATALDLLSEDGHVIAPVVRLHAGARPDVTLERVGRNRATTFAGLCSAHDHKLFAPMEKAVLNLQDVHHRFLLAYRATYYETHATAAAAAVVQAGYLKSADLGITPRDVPSRAGMFSVERMIVAYETWKYKSRLDEAYLEERFDALEHDLLELRVNRPTLAASVLFALDDVDRGDDVVRVCLTILPVSDTLTYALLSYLPEDAPLARASLTRVLDSQGSYQKYELSRRLINHAQNFVLAPSFVRSWSSKRKETITDLFKRTVFLNDFAFDDPDLTLFE